MSDQPFFSTQVPISALAKIHPALAAISGTTRLEFLEAKCICCSARLSADDLRQLSDEAKLPARLERVRMEYCARRTCESRFYRVTCRGGSPGLQNLLEAFQVTLVRTPARRQPVLGFSNMTAILGLLCAVGYVLFILHHLYYGERIPLWQRPHFY